MLRRMLSFFLVAFAMALSAPALAQDPPAVAAVPEAARAELRARIEAAKTEAAVSYWDAVIQPETNAELTAEFRRIYGLPASFQVKYTLSATLKRTSSMVNCSTWCA